MALAYYPGWPADVRGNSGGSVSAGQSVSRSFLGAC